MKLLRRATFPSLVVLMAAAVAAACAPGDEGPSGGVVPPRASILVEADLRRGEDGQASQLREVLGRVPAWRLVDQRVPTPQRVLDQLLLAVGAQPRLDWEDEVEVWLGSRGGAAGWLEDGSPAEFAGIAWFESTDDGTARDALRQALGDADGGRYEGTEIFRGKARSGDVHWAVAHERVIVGSDKGALTAALRAADGEAADEGTDWERLQSDRDSLVSVYTTPELVKQLERFVEAGDSEDEQRQAQRRYLQLAIEQLAGKAQQLSVHVGADADGVWMHSVAVGDEALPEVADDVPDARDGLESLPVQTVLGASSRSAAEGSEDMTAMRQQLEQLSQLLSGAGTAGVPAWLRNLPALLEATVSPQMLELAEDAYRGDVSVAVTVEGGQLSLLAAAGLDDERAALELQAAQVRELDRWLRRHTRLRASSAPTADGSKVTLSGIPAQQLRRRLEAATGQRQKVRTNPLVQRFLQPTLTVATRHEDELELFAVPADAMRQFDAAVEGGETLADDPRYLRDRKAAELPDDADYVFWMDLRELLEPIVQPLDAQSWALVQAQLADVGGPIGWGTSERDGDDTIRRFTLEVPLYE